MGIPRIAYLTLVTGLVATSQSGNIIRLGSADPVAITAYRLLFALVVLLPLAAPLMGHMRALSRADLALLVLAGVALAAHWFAWIAAVQLSTVANAAVFFSVNPVLLAATGYLLFGERMGARLLLSLLLGMAGVVVIGAGDLRLAPQYVTGDLMAVLCAALFAVYFTIGKRLRRRLPNRVYVVGVYGVACVVSFVVLYARDLPVTGYDGQTWLCFALMALVPTLLGHTGLNHALRYFDVSRISVATLTEPAMAGVVAFYAWDETITAQTGAGFVLIGASVLVLAMDRPGARTSGASGTAKS